VRLGIIDWPCVTGASPLSDEETPALDSSRDPSARASTPCFVPARPLARATATPPADVEARPSPKTSHK
jgi:hypothetical protein